MPGARAQSSSPETPRNRHNDAAAANVVGGTPARRRAVGALIGAAVATRCGVRRDRRGTGDAREQRTPR